jgi:LPS sulfotransferase NodH
VHHASQTLTSTNAPGAQPFLGVWQGGHRPTPAELLDGAFDRPQAAAPVHKLLVCAAPRTSSKRLARLLLGAGLGVPLEYFNSRNVAPLCKRWGVGPDAYLATLLARRTVNDVFAANMQFRQIEQWGRAQDFSSLFAGATVIHLKRQDRVAQATSLAACMLTDRWGFEEVSEETVLPDWRLKRAARKAVQAVSDDDGLWERWFQAHQVRPVVLTTEAVNTDNLEVIATLAARLDSPYDQAGAARMLQLDSGPYRGDRALKARLHAMIAALPPF